MSCHCFQVTASDATFISLLAARTEILRKLKNSGLEDMEVNSRLVAYCSDQVWLRYFSKSVESSGVIASIMASCNQLSQNSSGLGCKRNGFKTSLSYIIRKAFLNTLKSKNILFKLSY